MVELHREGSTPAACAAGLFSIESAFGTDFGPWEVPNEENLRRFLVRALPKVQNQF